MNRFLIIFLMVAILINLSSCGKHSSKVHEKRQSPTDIKIEKLDLAANNIQLRFAYRSHTEKVLNNINCEILLNHNAKVYINKSMTLQLSAFSTEILKFNDIEINNLNNLRDLSVIDYSVYCEIVYDKGTELVEKFSALHLTPGSHSNYR